MTVDMSTRDWQVFQWKKENHLTLTLFAHINLGIFLNLLSHGEKQKSKTGLEKLSQISVIRVVKNKIKISFSLISFWSESRWQFE